MAGEPAVRVRGGGAVARLGRELVHRRPADPHFAALSSALIPCGTSPSG
ncbi:hypothetical protein [Actinophytocola sp.]|nr:hypothetical protein [Actinophytocola sp.]